MTMYVIVEIWRKKRNGMERVLALSLGDMANKKKERGKHVSTSLLLGSNHTVPSFVVRPITVTGGRNVNDDERGGR